MQVERSKHALTAAYPRLFACKQQTPTFDSPIRYQFTGTCSLPTSRQSSCPPGDNQAAHVLPAHRDKKCIMYGCMGGRTRCQTQASSQPAASSRGPRARAGACFLSSLSRGAAELMNDSGSRADVEMDSPSWGLSPWGGAGAGAGASCLASG